MASKSPEQKRLNQRRQEWLSRSAEALCIEMETAKDLLSTERRQSARINPLAGDVDQTLIDMKALGWEGEQYDWMPEGYTIESGREALRDSDLIKEGRVYIQNAASWLSALALDAQPDDRILDVCAAPGGKTTHIGFALSPTTRLISPPMIMPSFA